MNRDVDVLIIGAGVSGIGFAIQLLRQYNTRNFELIEKSDQIGGTWWVNSYPGCGCDVCLSFRCCFSLRPNLNASTGSLPLLLILLRPQPKLVPKVRPPARDRRLLQGCSGPVPDRQARTGQGRGRNGPLGRLDGNLVRHDSRPADGTSLAATMQGPRLGCGCTVCTQEV